MPDVFGIDHRYFVVGAFCLSSGVAAYSSYQLWMERRKKKDKNVYESQKLVDEYLVFHYGSADTVLKYDFGPKSALDFPKRCADVCIKHFKGEPGVPLRAFDIGCAVGRHSFELAKRFDEVIGLDYSQAFVDACNKLKEDGVMRYSIQDEGDIVQHLVAQVSSDVDRSKTSFIQGDACDLPTNLGQFGCVLAANLICRLHHPQDFFSRLSGLVAKGGILVITSPYTWLEQFTEKSQWLGGFYDGNKKAVTGFDTLKKTLGPDFDLVEATDMPFFIRKTARKNQWTVAHCTVWKRKNN